MNETDTYREWSPPAAWRAMVACLWEQRIRTDTDFRVLPDGCADVIVAASGDAVALRRLLMRHTGLGPKEHQRVMRLQRFLANPAQLRVERQQVQARGG